jgi:sulfur transfer complex TusBCD TusB component (DsrH family)
MGVSFASCEKENEKEQNKEDNPIENSEISKDVYVVGYERSEVGSPYGKYVATLWKNGVKQYLTDGTNYACANSVFVSGSDVYVVGYENIPKNCVARLWKNGVKQNLTDEILRSVANSVYVSGNDVYVAGYECTIERDGESYSTDPCIAKLWKNGAAINLTDGTRVAEALSVYVLGNDVYVVGYELTTDYYYVAKLWKNGVAQDLSGITYVYSVCASKNDVYVAGTSGYICGSGGCGFQPLLWKNGVVQNLGGMAYVYSVFVSDNNVYVTGSDGNVGKLWKNGVEQNINGISYAKSACISGNDVYVAGMSRDYMKTAQVWKNGTTQNLSMNGEAYCVFVK